MVNINIDFSKTDGIIKDMNGLNNGPIGSAVRQTGGFELFKALEIPYSRTHDSSFCESYGGEHVVDVHRIFKNFDADENDPDSYLFGPTDKYLASIDAAGTKIYYRLGASIEHGHKVGTQPPKDYEKWARICEHIIMHYTEGWADGFKYDIEYWEVWNEPDCINADGSNPCWQGSEDEFLKFFEIAVKYLKNRFPHLKFGGPGDVGTWERPYIERLFQHIAEHNIPIDFYDYHAYLKRPDKIFTESEEVRKRFAKYGITDIELFVDEWNYVRGWLSNDFSYSLKAINSLKGSSLVAGTMCAGQASSIDKLMYYDGRPGGWCGLYSQLNEPQKTYHVFKLFRDFKKYGNYVKTEYVNNNIYYCAATNGENGAIFLTNYSEHDTAPAKEVKIKLDNIINKEKGARIKFYKLDENHNGELLYDEPYAEFEDTIELTVELFTTYLIEIIPNK